MFERLLERGARRAATRTAAKVRTIEAELRAGLPQGIGCEASDKGVAISGRGLLRLYVLDPALRSTIGRVR